MRVCVVGGSGMIGSRLVADLAARGDEVVVVSRRAGSNGQTSAVRWDPAEGPPPHAALAGADAVVNLAGHPIVGRWSAAKRRAIRDSRVVTTRYLAEALGAGAGPATLVNGSAVGFYGSRGEDELTEESGPGTGFLAEVCQEWEAATGAAASGGVRVVRARIGLVLDRNGGALPVLARLTKLLAGGPVGGGRQWYPWIHATDVSRALMACIDDAGLSGAVNVVGPAPSRQREVASTLGRVMGRPAFMPTPAAALRLALGEAADLVLMSGRVLPAALGASGFTFSEPSLEGALRAELDRST